MVKFIQINLRKSDPARRLLEQTVRELGSDILIMSEISRGPPRLPEIDLKHGWKDSGGSYGNGEDGGDGFRRGPWFRVYAVSGPPGLQLLWI